MTLASDHDFAFEMLRRNFKSNNIASHYSFFSQKLCFKYLNHEFAVYFACDFINNTLINYLMLGQSLGSILPGTISNHEYFSRISNISFNERGIEKLTAEILYEAKIYALQQIIET